MSHIKVCPVSRISILITKFSYFLVQVSKFLRIPPKFKKSTEYDLKTTTKTIRLLALNLYEMIVDSGFAHRLSPHRNLKLVI